MNRHLLDRVLSARADKRSVAVVTALDDGTQCLIEGSAIEGDLTLRPEILAEAKRALVDDRSTTLTDDNRRLFVHCFNPPARLVVVGAVHIAQPLAPMASLAGYGVTIVDPRRAFATDARFPQVELSDEWPDEALARLKPDRRTAVVTLTHDPKLDDPALAAALRSEAFYVGALGSKRTHAKRLERLKALGLSDAELGRIHGPVGLDIGAVSPAEIAVSILAEMTKVRHGEAE
jgi:xanthine dehydrogenase accessory factor